MQVSIGKVKVKPTNLQVCLSSFFILKLAVCSLQDINSGLADMNPQSWKRPMVRVMRVRP